MKPCRSVELPGFDREPFLYLAPILAASFALAYLDLSVFVRPWILLFGILLPLGSAALSPRGGSFPRKEDFPRDLPAFPVTGVLLSILAFSAATRFYRVGDLFGWPTEDEGLFGFAAMEILEGRGGPFFYGVGEVTPAFRYLLAGFFHFWEPSLGSLWLAPALVSILVIPAGYLAARQFFPRTSAMALAFFLASGFWTAFIGRLCMGGILMILLELIALGCLGAYSGNRDRSPFQAGILGAAVGAGLYASSPAWVPVAAAVSLAVMVPAFRRTKGALRGLGIYLGTTFLVAAPFFYAVIQGDYGSHVRELWPGQTGFHPLRSFFLAGSYFSAVLWGIPKEAPFVYGPAWGGFLNPLFSVLFLTGSLVVLRSGVRGPAGWWVLFGLLTLLPGWASHDLEMSRILMAIPFFAVLTLVGSSFLAQRFSRTWRAGVLAFVLVLSGFLDLYHLTVAYPEALRTREGFIGSIRSEAAQDAFRILDRHRAEAGPGLLFLDFTPLPFDPTLSIAAYPFNALRNPRWEVERAGWAAILVNANYAPFLKARFPDSRWERIGPSDPPWGSIGRWVSSRSGRSLRRNSGSGGAPIRSFDGFKVV